MVTTCRSRGGEGEGGSGGAAACSGSGAPKDDSKHSSEDSSSLEEEAAESAAGLVFGMLSVTDACELTDHCQNDCMEDAVAAAVVELLKTSPHVEGSTDTLDDSRKDELPLVTMEQRAVVFSAVSGCLSVVLHKCLCVKRHF